MTFETIRKQSAPEMVAAQIIGRIQRQELTPGSRLPAQRDLARIMGVGRSSVREAINALVAMGYLEAVHGSGTFVCGNRPDPAVSGAGLNAILRTGSILELMEAREVLECKSAELAAQRAEPDHVQDLNGTVDRMAAAGRDYPRFLQADIAFHTLVAEAAGNAIMGEMTRLVLDRLADHHRRLQTARLTSDYIDFSIHTARRVARCIGSGNGPRASEWMRRHLNAIEDELATVVG